MNSDLSAAIRVNECCSYSVQDCTCLSKKIVEKASSAPGHVVVVCLSVCRGLKEYIQQKLQK
jgi:hypothetical protein